MAANGLAPKSEKITIVKDHPEDLLKKELGIPIDVIRLKVNDPELQKILDG